MKYTLISQKKPNTSRTVALSLILLINAAFDVSLQFYDMLQAFVFYKDEFEHASSWLNIFPPLFAVANPQPTTPQGPSASTQTQPQPWATFLQPGIWVSSRRHIHDLEAHMERELSDLAAQNENA